MKIALVGNQNSGKTTLFNLLTGTNQKVGNWPGVTIERKEGKIKGTELTIVDLPGIYSLSPYTSEEEISRNYVLEENPDIIINIVDATCIERSLYLTTQLLELDTKVVIALNMCDELEAKGITIDEKKLSNNLDTTIVKISALKKTGIEELISVIKNNSAKENNHTKIYNEDLENLISSVDFIEGNHKRFKTVKMIDNDPSFFKLQNDSVKAKIKEIEDKNGYEIEQIIANERYNYIEKSISNCVSHDKKKISTSEKLDKIFLNKWAAIPIFIGIMSLIYFLSVGLVGSATVDLVAGLFESLSGWVDSSLTNAGASPVIISLLCDGIIAGISAVLGFVPQLIILFICIALLETSGYMSRIAFFFDKIFHKVGLNGKSLIPFIVGAGCSVPGIMTARTIEDEDERKVTILCTPFIPCSAKLPIIALFAGYFFNNSVIVTLSFYFLAIITILVSAIIMKTFFFKSNNSAFISELPEYKIPSFRYVVRDVFDKTIAYFKRAATVIFVCSIVIWVLCRFSWSFKFLSPEEIENSILASIGNAFAWIFYPMLGGNWSWATTVSAMQGLVAKEQVVSSMNIIAGLAGESEAFASLFGSSSFSFFSPLSAYAYCIFNLFSAPCFGAIGAMRRELGSKKAMFKAVLFQTGIAWIIATLIGIWGMFI
ncbi:MAG: ferrous iron transport protein B [Clostridia bacterium]|nr:ferrous iron transport protein B [Clostridia bacterium]